jgi:uncharacterized protein (TIGR01777 family)
MKILITGGTGFIGKVLVARLLAEGFDVTVLTRNPRARLPRGATAFHWEPGSIEGLTAAVSETDVIVNFAGESVGAKRWSARRKSVIFQSRIASTQLLFEAANKAKKRPRLLISASGADYYGNVPEGQVTESSPPGKGFLAEVCVRWEEKATAFSGLGMRVIIFRMGVVLGRNGGALAKMVLPFKLFVGGTLGAGRQWLAWVHRDDVVEAILFVLRKPNLEGIYNVVAPEPVTMKTFCRLLGRTLRRPAVAKVPPFALRLVLGEMADVILMGRRAVPVRLTKAGFHFKYPTLAEALKDVLR